jgi:peptidoglycan/LPS O-acetylase OafA/YrhL
MLFRSYNNAKGIWACELDSFFFFLAYLTFAFVFSFLSTVLIESPCHNLWREFVLKMPDPIYASFKQYNQRSKQAFEDKMGSSIFTTNSDECESLD